jgi:hypothetical protein
MVLMLPFFYFDCMGGTGGCAGFETHLHTRVMKEKKGKKEVREVCVCECVRACVCV